VLREFRDDELEHLDTAIEHGAQQRLHMLSLSSVIGLCAKEQSRLLRKSDASYYTAANTQRTARWMATHPIKLKSL